jgi:hypothetical protein
MESILTSIKKLLGLDEDYTAFDADIIMHINTVFGILTQLGVGPSEGFFIEDDSAIWDDYIPDDPVQRHMVKTYIHKKVQLMFDPPDRGAVKEALNNVINELEQRLFMAAESESI